MSDKSAIESYSAIAMQLRCRGINEHKDVAPARAAIMANVEKACKQVAGSVKFNSFFTGAETKLVVLPEFVLTGFPMGDTVDEWREKAALDPRGPEFELLSKTAQEAGIHLAGNAYEKDPNFPELYFQTCFVIAPNGDVVLRYRRMTSAFEPSPHDVWDKYLDLYGIDGVFPVAKTEIGNLACIASEEILWPELARCHVYRGAEIIIHPTSEPGSTTVPGRDLAKRTRAFENMAYVISANTANIEGIIVPEYTCCGMSKIIDYQGNVLCEAGQAGESIWANAVIELAALRRHRRRAGMANILSRQMVDVYAAGLTGVDFHPANSFLDHGAVKVPEGHDYYHKRQQQVIERLDKAGLL